MKTKSRFICVQLAALFLLSACQDNLEISSVGDTMAFDKTVLEAKAGSTVKLTFHNVATSPAMSHDWVLVRAGKEEAVAMAGLTAGQAKDYLPDSPDIL